MKCHHLKAKGRRWTLVPQRTSPRMPWYEATSSRKWQRSPSGSSSVQIRCSRQHSPSAIGPKGLGMPRSLARTVMVTCGVTPGESGIRVGDTKGFEDAQVDHGDTRGHWH